MRLINIEDEPLLKTVSVGGLSAKALWRLIKSQRTIKAIPVEQLLSILSNTYDEIIGDDEDGYEHGFVDGWNTCLEDIKKELDCWKKENE